MKKVLILITVILLYSCKSKRVIITDLPVEKSAMIVQPELVDVLIKNRAYNLGTRLLESCNTSSFKPFSSEEATEKVRQNATLERVSETCKKINFRNGKFISLQLIEIKQDQINNTHIFKYAITYEKKYFKRELTVIVNSENKVSAISTKEVKRKPM